MSYYYISHHGVPGQRWGVRRYQNKDGSLTSAGKKHQSEKTESSKKKSGLTKGQKIAIGIGVGVGAAAAAYGIRSVAKPIHDLGGIKSVRELQKLANIKLSDIPKEQVKNDLNFAKAEASRVRTNIRTNSVTAQINRSNVSVNVKNAFRGNPRRYSIRKYRHIKLSEIRNDYNYVDRVIAAQLPGWQDYYNGRYGKEE